MSALTGARLFYLHRAIHYAALAKAGQVPFDPG